MPEEESVNLEATTELQSAEISKFVNERLRPSAEQMKKLNIVLADHLDKWNQIKDQIPNDSTTVDDGRSSQGISQLTGSQIHTLATAAQQIKDVLDQAAADQNVADAVTTAQVRSISELL